MSHPAHVGTLTQVITAIGSNAFFAASAGAICELAGFTLSTIVLHRRGLQPYLCFDNFDEAGGRVGLGNYLERTHRFNPMLKSRLRQQVVRASEFRVFGITPQGALLRSAPQEELGFLTDGWPPHLEEVGLYFEACGGIVEWSLYRERGRRRVSKQALADLNAATPLVQAALWRHCSFHESRETPRDSPSHTLSAREQEVSALMIEGYGTEAIGLRLRISMHTVKDHRKRIFRKLRVGSLAEFFALHHPCRAQWLAPSREG
jgi:DNA-binding CsgD family transcriptional regulator